MARTPTYIVTGGAGFVGSNLAAELIKRNPTARVVIIDDFRSGSFANIVEACVRSELGPFSGEVIPSPCDTIDWPSLLDKRVGAVFHLAAITDTTVSDERRMMETNSSSFDPLLKACTDAGIPLVYASSAATYGSPPQGTQRVPFPVDAAGRPNNIYGFSKWMMEVAHRRMAAKKPTAHIVGLRYFNVFGPGESRKGKMASMVYQLTTQLLAGKPPKLFSDGSQARDQVSVEDVVDCTIAAAGLGKKKIKPGVYNLGSGVATSFNDILASIREALEIPVSQPPTEYFDMPASVRAFYQDYTCADMSATAKGLGWKPRHKPTDAIKAYARTLRAVPWA